MKIQECVLLTPETTAENYKLAELKLIWFEPSSGFRRSFPTYVCDLWLYKNSETIQKKLKEK